MFLFLVIAATIASALLGILLRVRTILNPQRRRPLRHGRRNPNEPTHLLIVLGSGGHTAEMIAMLERAIEPPQSTSSSTPTDRLVWNDHAHRTWVVSEGDSLSALRAKSFEELAAQTDRTSSTPSTTQAANDLDAWGTGTYQVVTVPRARKIHQSLLTAPISCLSCMQACWTILTSNGRAGSKGEIDFPDLILCNGPATATILILTSVALRFLNIGRCNSRNKMRTVYIESWARVQRLSLSGRLLTFVVDRFVVQWPQLARKVGGRVEYLGVLV